MAPVWPQGIAPVYLPMATPLADSRFFFWVNSEMMGETTASIKFGVIGNVFFYHKSVISTFKSIVHIHGGGWNFGYILYHIFVQFIFHF